MGMMKIVHCPECGLLSYVAAAESLACMRFERHPQIVVMVPPVYTCAGYALSVVPSCG